jgi:hypothetical protein
MAFHSRLHVLTNVTSDIFWGLNKFLAIKIISKEALEKNPKKKIQRTKKKKNFLLFESPALDRSAKHPHKGAAGFEPALLSESDPSRFPCAQNERAMPFFVCMQINTAWSACLVEGPNATVGAEGGVCISLY